MQPRFTKTAAFERKRNSASDATATLKDGYSTEHPHTYMSRQQAQDVREAVGLHVARPKPVLADAVDMTAGSMSARTAKGLNP